MLVFQAVALVVLVAELAEELRKRKLDALRLLLVPGRGAEVVAPLGGGNGLHLLDADDARKVVPARLNLGESRQERDAPGEPEPPRAGPWATRWEGGIDLDEERAEVALLAVELSGEVADVTHLDVSGIDVGRLESAANALAHERREVLALLRPVAGKVGLVAAKNVDIRIL